MPRDCNTHAESVTYPDGEEGNSLPA